MYRKYTHRVSIPDALSDRVLGWLSSEMPGSYRKYSRRDGNGTRSSVCVFCKGKEFRRIMDEWGHAVSSVTVPIDAEAEDLLLDGIRLDIRNRLYWGKYRYSLHFWERWGNGGILQAWVTARLGPPDGSYRFVRHRYFPMLYLADRSQLAMLRLAEPPCRIVDTKRAYTHDEVRRAIR